MSRMFIVIFLFNRESLRTNHIEFEIAQTFVTASISINYLHPYDIHLFWVTNVIPTELGN